MIRFIMGQRRNLISSQIQYRITAFTNGNEDVNSLHLQLDHVQDRNLRPLDELFTDNFLQGILKHMKGVGDNE